METNAKVGKRYGICLVLIALGAAAHVLFFVGQSEYPFLTFYVPITLAAMFAGFGPAFLGAAISTLVAWYFFVSPAFSFALTPEDAAALTLFFASGTLVAYGVSRGVKRQPALRAEYAHYGRHS